MRTKRNLSTCTRGYFPSFHNIIVILVMVLRHIHGTVIIFNYTTQKQLMSLISLYYGQDHVHERVRVCEKYMLSI